MNKFTIEFTNLGFKEILEYQGETIVKNYVKDEWGYSGENRAWEYEDLPDELIEAIEDGDDLALMDALKVEEAES